MAEGSEQSEWRYEFKKGDPASAKAAYDELLHDDDDPLTLVDIDDDCTSPIDGVVVYRNETEEVVPCSADIEINFKELQLKLPENLKDIYPLESSGVSAKSVRYVGMPQSGPKSEENDGSFSLLSLWNKDGDRDIVMVNISHSDSKQAVLFLNAMSRLIYESNAQSAVRTHKFYVICEGPIDVSCCSADERDERDAAKQKKESADKEKSTGETEESDGKKEDDFAELKRSPMYVTVDEEAILLFQNPFSPTPLHDFRFYREATEKSIDTIFVCNSEDQLEIQQGDNVFFIHPQRESERSSKCYQELVKILRDGIVKPKSKEVFTGTAGAFAKIFKPDEANDDFDDVVSQSRRSDPSSTFNRSNQSMGYGQPVSWISNLVSGAHLLTVSEDMQMMWFSVEPELDQLIRSGAIPESDIHSSGLNPESLEQLQTAVESIRDKLLSQSYAEALSHVRGLLKVYGETLLTGVVVDQVSDVDLLKRIYFLV